MTLRNRLRERVDATRVIDTHEHLLDESSRLSGNHVRLGCSDWGNLFAQYVCDDLTSSGLSNDISRRLLDEPMDPVAKFALLEPYWQRVRHTGYGQSLRLTVKALYDEDDITAENVPRIAERFADLRRPGMHKEILTDRCGIDYCHVNSMEHPVFHESDEALLLGQDIAIVHLISPFCNEEMNLLYGDHMESLEAWEALIVSLFDRFGPRATGVKSLNAYHRRLNWQPVDRRRASTVFREGAKFRWAPPDDIIDLEDYLLRFCLEQARKHSLVVKFHTGYHSGCGTMKLGHVATNAADISLLLRDFPDVNFDIFHIGYPYQNEMIALLKHFPNAYVDMCWAWIIDPVSAVDFLKKFLVTAPSNKLFGFGGDYIIAEHVVGHIEIARRGITQALAELVEENWIAEDDTPQLIDAVLHQNALDLFGAPPTRKEI